MSVADRDGAAVDLSMQITRHFNIIDAIVNTALHDESVAMVVKGPPPTV